MPTYEYLCEANGRVVEVQHKMAETLSTWGDLCGRLGMSPGKTDPKTRVKKLISASFVSTGSPPETACDAPACVSGGCASGLCEPP